MPENEMPENQMPENEPVKARTPKTPTAGTRYVAQYLPNLGRHADSRWLAEAIDDGRLIACPRCHFLYLPLRPFPLDTVWVEQGGVPVDACDVCAAIPTMCDPLYWGESWSEAMVSAESDLDDERTGRAITLFNLYIGASDAAATLRISVMVQSVNALRALSRTHAEEAVKEAGEQSGQEAEYPDAAA